MHWDTGPHGPDTPRPYLTGPLCPVSNHGNPVALLKFQMALELIYPSAFLKKKEKKKRGAQMRMSERGQGLTILSHSTPPTQWTGQQP